MGKKNTHRLLIWKQLFANPEEVLAVLPQPFDEAFLWGQNKGDQQGRQGNSPLLCLRDEGERRNSPGEGKEDGGNLYCTQLFFFTSHWSLRLEAPLHNTDNTHTHTAQRCKGLHFGAWLDSSKPWQQLKQQKGKREGPFFIPLLSLVMSVCRQ